MLKDVLIENLNVVFCGTAKGKASTQLGYYYAGPNNKFYTILNKAGFTRKRLLPNECYEINKYKICLTDLVTRFLSLHLFLEVPEDIWTRLIGWN